MKKLYTALCALALSSIAANATVNANFVIDKDDLCYITYYDSNISGNQTVDLVAGDNKVEVPNYAYVSVYPKSSDIVISSVTNSYGGYTAKSGTYWYTSMPSGDYYTDEVTVTITAGLFDDLADAQLTLTIDDPTAVSCTLGSRDMIPLVTAGEPATIKYISSSETQMSVSSSSYSGTIYKVTQNGNTIASNYGSYYITVADGDVIDVKANYPEEDVDVTFTYDDPKSEGCITGVTVDGVAVSDFANGFQGRLGKKVYLTLDTSNYNISDIYINDVRQSYYGYSYFEFTLTDASVIRVVATKYEQFEATINIDDPSRVTVKAGGSVLSLVAGDNLLSFTAGKTNTLSLEATTGNKIVSISDGENELYDGTSKYPSVTISEGQTLTITTAEIEYDSKAVLYVDDLSLANYNYYYRTPDNNYVYTLDNGYNVVKFDSTNNNYYFGFYGSAIGTNYVGYLNDEAYTDASYGDTYISANVYFTDGDVLKLFFAGEPSKYAVTFDVAEAIADKFEVTRDKIVAVPAYTEGFNSFAGTEVAITSSLDDAIVTVNDTEVVAADGVFTFTVDADSQVVLTSPTSVAAVAVDANSTVNVYNLQGIRVLSNASAAQISNLPKGLYIVNGKKQLVK